MLERVSSVITLQIFANLKFASLDVGGRENNSFGGFSITFGMNAASLLIYVVDSFLRFPKLQRRARSTVSSRVSRPSQTNRVTCYLVLVGQRHLESYFKKLVF